MNDTYLSLVLIYNRTCLNGHCYGYDEFRWYLKTHGWPIDNATEAALAVMKNNNYFKRKES